MILNARPGLPPLAARYGVCIVGGGPAGITLALKLAEGGQRVLLLEAGDHDYTPESQDLYDGEILGQEYPDLRGPRLRYLGGTTGHWGGRCLALEPFDFEPRADVPLSGWPIRAGDLKPYEAGAAAMLRTIEIGQTRRLFDGDLDAITQRWSTQRKPHQVTSVEILRFGSFYRAALEQSAAIDVVLNANVTGLSVDGATGRITAAQVQGYDGASAAVQADRFVLAMGGIENSRFLLLLNERNADRFGNQGGMVGRCFMEHPLFYNGAYFVTRRLFSHYRYWGAEKFLRAERGVLALSPSPAFMRRAGTLNCVVHLSNVQRTALDPSDTEGAAFVQGLRFDQDYFFIGDTFSVGEQAPNPASRIVLVEGRDRFGLRKAGLDWQLSPIDGQTLRTATLEVARMLIRTGLGRMKMPPEVWNNGADLPYDLSYHHMGGARMSDTPETGVVNRDCRVHGAPNLYVAGAGVFCTSGAANPTFTIVQLALRLADHLLRAA